MLRKDYKTCEPFRAWNRLEGRTRKEDFDQTLQARIQDPLWFLTRQWQFGEFKGEDTGSAIFAKIQIENTKISQLQLKRGQMPRSYGDEVPIETLVERETHSLDFKSRVQAGKYFMRLLDRHALPNVGYVKGEYLDVLLQRFPMVLPELDPNDSPKLQVQKAKLRANKDLEQFFHTVKGRAFDGVALYEAISSAAGVPGVVAFLAQDNTHRNFVKDSLEAYKTWFGEKYDVITTAESAWNPSQLEYQFGCALPNENGNNTVLMAEEYYTGTLDWYTFDINGDANEMQGGNPAERESHISTETLTIIPTEVQFPGMPNSRWWEFEDGQVDLGNITASTTDVAKIILAEFALIYGNDWFSLPHRIPVGSISKIKGIVVKDVFGQQTLVQAANQGENEDWSGWGMFNLTTRKTQDESTLKNNVPIAADTRLFIPPTVAKVQESEPLEEVRFVRDEMANLVWAIETTIPNMLGKGQEGDAAARNLKEMLDQEYDLEAEEIELADEAMLRYTLGNSVPENWIPFMAVHSPGQNRDVRLQRASMPRIMKEGYLPVRPRTLILGYGMKNDIGEAISPFVNASAEEQEEPYFVIEEEITKSGVHLTSTHQRTRWYSGKTYNWQGRRKTLGRGEGASGLQYDHTEFVSKKET